jgi:hypothetical protein
MANSTIVGNATIYGVDGTVTYGTLLVGENFLQSVNLTDDVDTAEARDQKGNVFGYNLYNFRRTATFEIIVIGPTQTQPDPDEPGTEEQAAANCVLPTPGATITIAQDGESGDNLPAILVGTWNYIGGGTISMSNTDITRLSLPCSQYNADTAGSQVDIRTFTH